MTIGVERFEARGLFATCDPYAMARGRMEVFGIQCRNCGYEPRKPYPAPVICPKCQGSAFERFTRPGSILHNASRF